MNPHEQDPVQPLRESVQRICSIYRSKITLRSHGKFGGMVHETPHKLFAVGLPLSLAWGREYVGELRTPAGLPAMSPITSFSGRAVGSVKGIDEVYVERGGQSSNDHTLLLRSGSRHCDIHCISFWYSVFCSDDNGNRSWYRNTR